MRLPNNGAEILDRSRSGGTESLEIANGIVARVIAVRSTFA